MWGMAALAVVVALAGGTTLPSARPTPAGAADRGSLTVGAPAWVAVSVATLWRTPASPRPVDAPALARPVRVRAWLARMTLTQRRGLAGRADTQALLGDRVTVVRLRPGWARVVVASQPTPLDARGYPGWVPRRQLSADAPDASSRRATVLARTTWLHADTRSAGRVFPVSFGTSLPVLAAGRQWVRVSLPGGAVRRLSRPAVAVHDSGAAALPATRASLVRVATSFVGLDYLWSGVSGFGLDCSGLTWLDYRVHGVRIPRDALPQSRGGTAVATPRRADLLFYAAGGPVHHVTMYVGHGRMVHAPHTGAAVAVVPTSSMASQYAGARRYLR